MSASLVGSEMCIRDSASSSPRAGWGLRSTELWLRRPQPRPPRAWGAAPVSYTHLTLPTICSV
eukprot:3850385-Alexandrium_andersonii.AAC.1